MVREVEAAELRREERVLLAEVLAGSGRAWERFSQRYQALIAACVRKVLHRYSARYDHDDLADLIADVWIALLKDDRRKLRQYDAERGYRLSSWVGLIATNTTIDALRARTTKPSFIEDMEGFAERHLVEWRSPQHAAELSDAARLAKAALEQLDDDERRFVIACFHEEQAPSCLAAELGISVNTVYSRKFKVRAKLVRIAENIDQTAMAVA